jgi:3-methyl-2-oxobutanoate hydroxymethyltransferase
MSERLSSVIIISAGAGPDCDGQSVNLYDTIGLTQGNIPKFSKQYARVADIVHQSIASYCRETEEKRFPTPENCYTIDAELESQIIETIEGTSGK